MHAYDLDTIAGHQIVVKNAQDGGEDSLHWMDRKEQWTKMF